MNSLERIAATVAFRKPDRVPVVPQVFGQAAVLAGVPLASYLHDGALLARCQVAALRHYGYDAVFAFADVGLEAEALGSVLEFPEGQYPQLASPALAPGDPIGGLQVPDPERAGRMPELLKATRLLRGELDGAVPVVAVVTGPMSLAGQLLGTQDALYLAADEPLRFEELLDIATATALRYGRALLAAGAQVALVFEPAASPAVVPPAFFREMLLPRLRTLLGAFKQAGALACWLHIAGPIEPILRYYPEAGADIANVDYEVQLDVAARALPRTCLDGNLRSLSFVLDSPAKITDEAQRLLSLLGRRGGFILSSGCEIPPEAKPENLAALVAAVQP